MLNHFDQFANPSYAREVYESVVQRTINVGTSKSSLAGLLLALGRKLIVLGPFPFQRRAATTGLFILRQRSWLPYAIAKDSEPLLESVTWTDKVPQTTLKSRCVLLRSLPLPACVVDLTLSNFPGPAISDRYERVRLLRPHALRFAYSPRFTRRHARHRTFRISAFPPFPH